MRVHLIRPPVGIFFDHDGTLVDSLDVVVEATNAVLVAEGLDPAPRAVVVAAMVKATGPRMGFHCRCEDPQRQDRLAQDFYREANRLPHLARTYPGVPALLGGLAGRGLRLGLVSNNQGAFVRRVLNALGLAAWLQVVLGEEDMPAPKPDPRGLLSAARRCGCAAPDCWYVGDSAVDLAVARAAGMGAVGVTWGTTPRRELEAMGFDLLVDTPGELALAALDGKGAGTAAGEPFPTSAPP